MVYLRIKKKALQIGTWRGNWTEPVWYEPPEAPGGLKDVPPLQACLRHAPGAVNGRENPEREEIIFDPWFESNGFLPGPKKSKNRLQECFLYHCWSYLFNDEAVRKSTEWSKRENTRWLAWKAVADGKKAHIGRARGSALGRLEGGSIAPVLTDEEMEDEGYGDFNGEGHQRTGSVSKKGKSDAGDAMGPPPKPRRPSKRKTGNSGKPDSSKKRKTDDRRNKEHDDEMINISDDEEELPFASGGLGPRTPSPFVDPRTPQPEYRAQTSITSESPLFVPMETEARSTPSAPWYGSDPNFNEMPGHVLPLSNIEMLRHYGAGGFQEDRGSLAEEEFERDTERAIRESMEPSVNVQRERSRSAPFPTVEDVADVDNDIRTSFNGNLTDDEALNAATRASMQRDEE